MVRYESNGSGNLKNCIKIELEKGVFLLEPRVGGRDTGDMLRAVLRGRADALHVEKDDRR